MKKVREIIVFIIGLCFITGCKENNSTQMGEGGIFIRHIKTMSGGCNLDKNLSDTKTVSKDTVIISHREDYVNAFVDFNYDCNAPFITECQIYGRNVVVYIIDTCETLNCYERCYCDYSFLFMFKKQKNVFQKDNQCRYKIILKDPRKEPEVISEGIL